MHFQYTVLPCHYLDHFVSLQLPFLGLKRCFTKYGEMTKKSADSIYAFSSFCSSNALGNFNLTQNMSHLEALLSVVQTQLVHDDINNHIIKYFRNCICRNFL